MAWKGADRMIPQKDFVFYGKRVDLLPFVQWEY